VGLLKPIQGENLYLGVDRLYAATTGISPVNSRSSKYGSWNLSRGRTLPTSTNALPAEEKVS